MSDDKGHGYGWEDLRERPARDLAVGDVWVSPAAFSAYTAGPDGRVAGAFGWEGPRGTAWTLTARNDDVATCRSHDGREEKAPIPAGARVLVVTEEARAGA